MKRETRWSVIPEFPDYIVDELGNIYNTRRRTEMRTSRTNHGHVKIALKGRDGERHTRSVSLLVAEAFVDRPNELCDTVMMLDGNLENVRASNLAWRPRWFAWKYTRQLKMEQPLHFRNLAVSNITDNVEYRSIVDGAMFEGLLFQDIWRSTYSGSRVFPYGSVWEISERV